MKIIFLDVDGVLNSENYFRERVKSGKKPSSNDMIEYFSYDIDPDCMKRLQNVVDRTGAKIVLSSTWRIAHYEDFIELLKKFNMDIEVIDKTPQLNFPSSVRGNEILEFMKKNAQWCGPYMRYTDYVIIDDSADMLYMHKDNFVQTSWECGLQDEDVEKCVEILNTRRS